MHAAGWIWNARTATVKRHAPLPYLPPGRQARELLAEGSPGVDEREAAQGQTALHIAAEWSNVEFMRLLREHSAAIDEADSLGLTPLLAGAANGVLEPLRLLAQWGADLAATEPSRGRSATHLVR